MPSEPVDNNKTETADNAWAWLVLVFLLFWVISGIAAFFMSILCFAYSGTLLEKVGGFAISVLFGPFYWIYYAFVNNYCNDMPNQATNASTNAAPSATLPSNSSASGFRATANSSSNASANASATSGFSATPPRRSPSAKRSSPKA